MEEFDLDKAIKIKPGLILIDELAHTNADAAGIISGIRISMSFKSRH